MLFIQKFSRQRQANLSDNFFTKTHTFMLSKGPEISLSEARAAFPQKALIKKIS